MKKLPSAKSFLWPGVVCTLAAVLVTLGVLQYRWSREISDATSARMRAGLAAAMFEFRRELFGELANIARGFPPDEADGLDLRRYSVQLAQWKKTAAHPALIQDVYVWQHGPQKSELVKIKLLGQESEHVAWPAELASLREDLPPNSGFFQAFSGRPPQSLAFNALGMQSKGGVVEFGPPGVQVSGEAIGLPKGDTTTVLRVGAPWMLNSSVPALVRPLAVGSRQLNRVGVGYRAVSAGWMIIVLNRAFLSEHIFPELTARYFSGIEGLDYDVAIVAGDKPERTIYSSSPAAAKTATAKADASMELLGPLPGPASVIVSAFPGSKGQTQSPMLATPNFGSIMGQNLKADLRTEETLAIGPMPPVSPSESWWLVVNNHQGSVEAAVARLQRRNLGLSFGVLAILAATMGTIILASRRAQELARLQMEFVAGVSHELRTPLAVISSAADNIADGVVQGSAAISKYGAALKWQAAQLRDLVEQILTFSATQQNRQGYSLRPAQMAEAVDLALKNSEGMIRDANCVVECEVRRDLPEIMIDVSALSRSIHNLIGNAIKYGGDGRWIGIKASTAEREDVVEITVTDRGIGIRAEDLKHIFEPFYRSAAVRDAQIHGNGLGLSVARSIVEAMGGTISVHSAPGRGSSFYVRLPAAVSVSREAALRSPLKVNAS